MGRAIIHEISRNESLMDNQLCVDDAEYVLIDNTVRTIFIYGFATSFRRVWFLMSNTFVILCFSSQETKVSQALLMKLRSARIEPSRLLKLDGNSENTSKKLRGISLHGVSSQYIPDDFCLHDVIAIYYFSFSIKTQTLTKIKIVTYYCFFSNVFQVTFFV